MTATLLEVRKITRRYGSLTAVDELTFTIEGGSIWGFIGPNGAGKTTTMRILATLDVPDAGDAFVAGSSVLVDPRLVRTKVGFMSDQFQPYANLDVGQFLDFFARANGLRGKQRIDTVRSVVSFCHLEGFLDRPATGLSKGMGQRVHLAKTLLHDPALLILDEPASGLDPHARIELRELLEELAANGKGILISSHILSELSEICDGAIVLERGKMVVAGKIGDLAQAQLAHLGTRVRVKALGEAEPALRFFATQPLVEDAGMEGGSQARGEVTFSFAGDEKQLAELLARAIGHGLEVVEFSRQQVDLEDIFLQTTRGRLQ